MDSGASTSLTWRVDELSGFDGLKLKSEPVPQQLGDHDCLVRIEASSLNFRDLMIPKVTSALLRLELSTAKLTAL